MRLAKRLSIVLFAPMLSLAACGGDEPGEEACTAPTGTDYTFVVNKVLVPTNQTEADALALDLNGTEPIRTDNKLGTALASLAAQAGLDLPTAVDGAVDAGDIILLVNVKSEDLTNAACAGVGVYLGANPSVAPCDADGITCGLHLQGDASFDVSPDSPTDTVIGGQILGGKFSLGPSDPPGNFTIELDLIPNAAPIVLNLVGARVEIGGVSDTGLTSGILGGAITKTDIETSILPAVHVLVEEEVAATCQGTPETACCDAGSAGETILNFFNTDGDCAVSLEELQQSAIVQTILNPDLDLLDAAGNYSPGADGENDSISLGLGFTAITGSFQVP